MSTIWHRANTLVKRGKCFVVKETERRVYFLTWSVTNNGWIDQQYIKDEDRFLPCTSTHGGTPEGGWIVETKGHHCAHLRACRILMEQNGMKERFETRQEVDEA